MTLPSLMIFLPSIVNAHDQKTIGQDPLAQSARKNLARLSTYHPNNETKASGGMKILCESCAFLAVNLVWRNMPTGYRITTSGWSRPSWIQAGQMALPVSTIQNYQEAEWIFGFS